MNKLALLFVSLAAVAFCSCGAKEDADTPAFNACSNTVDYLNLPFSYLLSEPNRIITPSYLDDTKNIYVHFAPFGAHFNPMTGHAEGNRKIDFAGFFSESDDEIKYIEAADDWGFYAGNEQFFHDRRPMYYAPAKAKITSIYYKGVTPDLYFLDEPSWMITLNFGELEIKLDHVGKISPTLHQFVLDNYEIDTHAYAEAHGNILPSGIYIAAPSGIEIAYPQIIASEVPNAPGYYNGAGSTFPDRPFVQIEFFTSAPTTEGNTDVCSFELLSPSLQSTFQSILDHDIVDPDSQRFGDWQDTEWQWRAESNACLSCSTYTSDLNGLYKDLGGWFERGDNGTIKSELVSFVPVAQDSASYDSTLYVHDVQTEWLMLRRRNDSQTWDWVMEDTSVVSTDYPAGEIVAVENDAMLVLWRDLGQATDVNAYQWVRYDLSNGVVTLKFGDYSDTEASALKPNFDLAVDLANDIDVITFDKTWMDGF